MQLPKEMQERLATEWEFALKKMREEENPFRKLYFFSAFYSEIARILNWSWDRDLVLLHILLNYAHQQFSARLKAIVTGQDTVIQISDQHFEELTRIAERLVELIGHDWDNVEFYDILGRLSELTFTTTGNGNYLLEKGAFKV